MARLSIPNEPTFATFTVTTSTTVFPITFSLFAKADLTVSVDGIDLDQADFSFSGTVLDGGGYDGGTVTLNTAVDDVEVRIERNVSPVRTTNFAPAATTPVGAVDLALNRQTAVAQDLSRRLSETGSEAADAFAQVAATQATIATTKAAEAAASETAAELAETNAETAETGAVTAQGIAEDARDAAIVYRDEAATAVSAIPPDITYATEAAGRAGVGVDGALFWLRAADGLQLYTRVTSGTSTPVQISGKTFTIPSKVGIGQLGPRIRVAIIAGAAEAAIPARDPARQFIVKVMDPLVTTSASLTEKKIEFTTALPKTYGAPDIEIRAYDGTTVLIAQSTIKDNNGDNILPANLWGANEFLEVERLPTGIIRMDKRPNTTLKTLAEMEFAVENDRPTVQSIIYGVRQTEKTWLFMARNVSGATRNDTFHCVKMYNMGGADSQGVLQNTHHWSANSHWLLHKGRRFDYANLSSTEGGGGVFTGLQHSTPELALRVGLMSDTNLNGTSGGHPLHDFYGYGHGGYEEVSTTFTVDGAGDYRNSAVGTEVRGNSVVITTTVNVFRPYIAVSGDKAARWIGQVVYVYTLNSTGLKFTSTHYIGRSLYFDAGSAAIVAGDTVTGGTSGATGVVVLNPTSGQTGSTGGGNLTGCLFLKTITGTWQDNEAIQVGGVTKATVNGTLGGAISMQNGYGPMLPTTNVNRAKVPGYAEETIGLQGGQQHPVSTSGTWPTADRIALWNTDDPDVLIEMLVPNGPITPPGDFSDCSLSKVFVQDRAEGVRKAYFNARSGAAVALYEGTYTTEHTTRFRIGSPV